MSKRKNATKNVAPVETKPEPLFTPRHRNFTITAHLIMDVRFHLEHAERKLAEFKRRSAEDFKYAFENGEDAAKAEAEIEVYTDIGLRVFAGESLESIREDLEKNISVRAGGGWSSRPSYHRAKWAAEEEVKWEAAKGIKSLLTVRADEINTDRNNLARRVSELAADFEKAAKGAHSYAEYAELKAAAQVVAEALKFLNPAPATTEAVAA